MIAARSRNVSDRPTDRARSTHAGTRASDLARVPAWRWIGSFAQQPAGLPLGRNSKSDWARMIKFWLGKV